NDKTAMKVGTDGVLIGAWCDVYGVQHVLDVGTGCGLIALMIAQRNSNAHILGIDIDDDSINEAVFNFEQSPWNERLSGIMYDFNDYNSSSLFDLIVSNPPFFNNGVEAPEHKRNQARHTSTLSFEQLITKSHDLLADNGILAIITPVEAENEIRRYAVKSNMSIKRLAKVVPVEGAAPKRLMWELVKGDSITQNEQITICASDKTYTQQYRDLTGGFYLNM
ncbi:MAG: methyltransferase, partial [Muribaculaceae bacterium]|nr:methyltransferase [Muribaculaceae bacterium]